MLCFLVLHSRLVYSWYCLWLHGWCLCSNFLFAVTSFAWSFSLMFASACNLLETFFSSRFDHLFSFTVTAGKKERRRYTLRVLTLLSHVLLPRVSHGKSLLMNERMQRRDCTSQSVCWSRLSNLFSSEIPSLRKRREKRNSKVICEIKSTESRDSAWKWSAICHEMRKEIRPLG